VFAEDDLRYLVNKMKGKNLTYYILILPENPIDISNLSGNIKTFNKNKDFDTLLEILKPVSRTSPFQSIPQETKPIEEPKAEELSLDSLTFDFEPQPIQTETKKEETFEDFSYDPYELKLDKKQEEKVPELEFNDINLDLDFGTLETTKEEKIEEIKIDESDLSSLDLDSFIEELEKETTEKTKQVVSETPEIKKQTFEFTEPKKQTQTSSFVSQSQEENKTVEEEKPKIEKVNLNDIIKPSEPKENIVSEGEDNMVANFNVQISKEDIKKVVLEVARDYIKNDPAMHTIIDHLQIDFQSETMRELENIKNQLKEKLREEAEKALREEITKLIKSEIKEYVAEITAQIVKERLEQAFKSF
ncbi:MAG: hypothetical protein ACP5KF_01150, partial [Sulfurihydrogenibium sp.]